MKSVLISIQPKWCELIASGQKTVEVRKTKPKLEPPFKVYIYCTQGDALALPCLNNPQYAIHRMNNGTINGRQITTKEREQSDHSFANGKVIGEFVCRRIDEYRYGFYDGEFCYHIPTVEGEKTCLNYDEAENYGNGKPLYFWHISDLVIYDKPKELSEFIKCPYSWDCGACDYFDGFEMDCKKIKRPPQSWCYVEKGE